MSMLCIPLPSLNHVPAASELRPDLFEFQRADHKVLRDIDGTIRFVDYDWQTPLPTSDDLIISYHNFEETPDDLERLLSTLRSKGKARYYKIATMARSTLDSLRMLEFVQTHPGVIGICMGEKGQATRILGPLFGTPILYAPLSPEQATAPGQLTMEELTTTYHFRKLGPNTPIYAVIGDPVSQSPGPLYHNARLQGEGVYLRLHITAEELGEFFTYVRRLPFRGLSVTIPHKIPVLHHLDEIDPEAAAMGAVNTIDVRKGRCIGYNTDGPAAVSVLGAVENKRIIVLGAGGAAQALIYALLQKGAHVTIVNRTPAKAEALAEKFHCATAGEERLSEPYDIVVQTTPVSTPWTLHPGTLAMDIALGPSPFLEAAQKQGCRTIDGYQMYVEQAEAQRAIWSRQV